ncbi:MAG TPA: methylenetetrahydrofolate reductase [Nitrososphaeria archaeon]|nr:methylenetetrahydrofolate reductase [Nitrososphaeria archaeon]
MKADSKLERILESGEFAVTAEIGPPKSADAEVIRRKARTLKGYIDAFNVTDGQTAVVRMASWAACLIGKEEGLEPIVQMTCRDRNRIALQMDILGVAALGIKNILCLTGDHVSMGNHPSAKPVYDLDSIQLIKIVKDMRDEKRFQCGEKITVEPRLYIGAVTNPFAGYPLELDVLRLEKKVKAGADFIQTQCVYDIEKFEKWMKLVRERKLHEKVHIIAGVTPLKSYRMAKYMKENVPGIEIPDKILERMRNAPKEKAREEGVEICVEIIERLKEIEGVHGIHVMAIGWENIVPVLVERARLLPRPNI